MACGSCGQRRPGQRAVPTRITASAGTSRTLYQVVLTSGAVAFQTNNVDLARSVQANYPGSRLNPDPDTEAPAEPAPAVTVSAPKGGRTRPAERPEDEVSEVALSDG